MFYAKYFSASRGKSGVWAFSAIRAFIRISWVYYVYFYNYITGDAKKTEDVQFERNSLQGQLRETQNSLRQQQESFTKMRQQLTATHTELDQSRLTIDTLKNKIHKVS